MNKCKANYIRVFNSVIRYKWKCILLLTSITLLCCTGFTTKGVTLYSSLFTSTFCKYIFHSCSYKIWCFLWNNWPYNLWRIFSNNITVIVNYLWYNIWSHKFTTIYNRWKCCNSLNRCTVKALTERTCCHFGWVKVW